MPDDFELYEGSYRAAKGGKKPPRNPFTGQPGCYVITHAESNRQYVGSSGNLAGRISSNLNALKHGKHKNKNLQEVFDQDPRLDVVIKATDTEEEAKRLEQETVDKLLPSGNLCNIAVQDVTKTRVGVPLTVEHIEALRRSNTTRVLSDETRKKMSDSHKGVPLSDDHKVKLSSLHIQRLSTPEGKAAHTKGIEKLRHGVVIGGVEYPSKSEAARVLGLHVTTIMHRCKSASFPDCYQIKEIEDG